MTQENHVRTQKMPPVFLGTVISQHRNIIISQEVGGKNPGISEMREKMWGKGR